MTSLIRFSPSREMRRLQREIDDLFESFLPTTNGGDQEARESAVWAPRVDLSETEDAYFIHVDVPGMTKDDLEINYQDGVLSVSGERRAEERKERHNFVRVERSFGNFYRSFRLPKAVDEGSIEATYENGVLTIEVQKSEESKPRRIEIH